jgi:hypothetical protein
MSGWTYDSGQFNLYCDVCKKKIKSSEAKHRWDGLIVCPDDWEQRHPQDFVKAKLDKIAIPFSRPTEVITYDTQYGMFDVVNIRESVKVYIDTLLTFSDTVTFTDVLNIGKGYSISDPVGFSDTVEFTWDAHTSETDEVFFTDSGYLYMFDYTTPAPPDASTYFAEDYVGLLTTFT